jgi:hypothetical protein
VAAAAPRGAEGCESVSERRGAEAAPVGLGLPQRPGQPAPADVTRAQGCEAWRRPPTLTRKIETSRWALYLLDMRGVEETPGCVQAAR